MNKHNNHLFLVTVVFFDLIILITLFIFSRYQSGFNLFKWKFFEVTVSICVIGILYIALEKFEFSHSYRFLPFFELIKKIIYFELFLLSIFYVLKISEIIIITDKFVFFYSISTFTVFIIERGIIKLFLLYWRKKGFDLKNYLIIGTAKTGIDFYNMANSSNEIGIKVIGFLRDDHTKNKKEKIDNPKIKSLVLGNLDKLEKILKTKAINNVIVTLEINQVSKIISIFKSCEKYGVKVELIPSLVEIISNNPSMRQIKKFILVGIRNVPLENMFNRFIKRLFDIALSLLGLLIFLPLFIITSIIIKINSKGPVFFLQKRTGYNQKEFNIIKFRTMKTSKDANLKQATKNDPRKTKIGDLLRKTNIDELPQIINILKGDMSVVGPRPHMLVHTSEFRKKYDNYLVRHWVKPGLTGWAQVNGWRGNSDIGIRVIYDIEYIEKWSLFFDIKILFLTVFGKKVKSHAY